MYEFIAGLIFTTIVLLLSHTVMVGLCSFIAWENWFFVSMELWDRSVRFFYAVIQLGFGAFCVAIAVNGKP